MEINESQLYSTIKNRFSLEEVKDICLELEIPHDDLSGDNTLSSMSRELVRKVSREGRIDDLISIVRRERSDFDIELAQTNIPDVNDFLLAAAYCFFNNMYKGLRGGVIFSIFGSFIAGVMMITFFFPIILESTLADRYKADTFTSAQSIFLCSKSNEEPTRQELYICQQKAYWTIGFSAGGGGLLFFLIGWLLDTARLALICLYQKHYHLLKTLVANLDITGTGGS